MSIYSDTNRIQAALKRTGEQRAIKWALSGGKPRDTRFYEFSLSANESSE